MSRFVLDPSGIAQLARDPEISRIIEERICEEAASRAAAIADGWVNQAGVPMVHEALGAYGTRSDDEAAYVVANTGFWHLIEFGVGGRPGSHALERGAEAAGLEVQ